MATTLGGGRDGAGELASHPGGGQPAGKAARDNGGSNGLNTGSDIAEAQPTGHEKHKAAWERYMVRKNKNHCACARFCMGWRARRTCACECLITSSRLPLPAPQLSPP